MRTTNFREREMLDYGHFIGGKRVAGTSGRTTDVMQPMDGTVRAKVALLVQLLQALAYLHRRGIFHRDLRHKRKIWRPSGYSAADGP